VPGGSVIPDDRACGAELRAAREARGLALADVSSHLKIREHLLDAMERDAHDELPGPPFGEKFLAQYRAFLGLEALPPPRLPDPTPEPTVTKTEPLLSPQARQGLIAAAGGIVLVIVALVLVGDRPGPLATTQPADLRLTVSVVDSMKARVVADGREDPDGQSLIPGKAKEFKAYDRLEIHLPRLDGVSLGWQAPGKEDPTPLKPLGAMNTPRTLVFIDDGGR
jgi:hypothetical protein